MHEMTSRLHMLFLLSLIFLGTTLIAQESKLKLVFTGDIMGHDTQIASALATGEPGYDYKPCFQYLRPYLQEADLVIGNLEVTFAGPPYKGYPAFSSPDELADALKWAGFDILVNANNHALDRGQKGMERTIEQLDQRVLIQTGTFTHPTKRATHYPLVMEKNGIRIALLNYTYGTNGLKDTPPAIVNRIDKVQIQGDLEKAATAEPDFILVTMHWGSEYQLNENSQQRDLANFMFRHGADCIIGSHPHVVQPIRGEGAGNLVVYSMGNLISNQRDRYRNGGILFELELVKGTEGPEILNFAYLPVWVWKPRTKKGTRFTLMPANLELASVSQLGMSPEDRGKMLQFLNDTRSRLKDCDESAVPSPATISPR
ncbi:MAG: CapA family protein [Bacteroidales bacterium]|nr:CapA family protein [Bacteroidales bacterium]